MPSTPSPLHLPSALLQSETIYRTIGATRDAGLIGIGVVDKSGRIHDATHSRPEHYSALYVLRGSGLYRDSTGIEARFAQGSIFQRFPDRHHTSQFDPGCRFVECFIALNRPLAETFMGMGLIDARRPVVHPGLDLAVVHDLRLTMDRLRGAAEHELPRLAAHLIEVLIDLLTRDRFRASGESHDEVIEEACRLLAARLDERKALADLIKRFHLSYERFRKVFRARMGLSPGEYRIRRRIDKARELLNDEHLSIKEIAYRLGYANPFVFSNQFKRMVGMAPEIFRRKRG